MKRKLSWMVGVMVSVALPVSPLWAAQASPLPEVKAQTREQFVAVKEQIHQQTQRGGRFEYITPHDRVALGRNVDHMQALFDKFGTSQAMDAKARLGLRDDEAQIKAILSRHDSERQVCQRKTLHGATVARNVCRTHGEIAREKLNEQKQL